jgi:hypothetical protein
MNSEHSLPRPTLVIILSQINPFHTHISYVRFILILPCCLCYVSQAVSPLQRTSNLPHLSATCTAHLILVYLIILILSDEENKLSNFSLYNFLCSTLTLTPLSSNILFSTLFLDFVYSDICVPSLMWQTMCHNHTEQQVRLEFFCVRVFTILRLQTIR